MIEAVPLILPETANVLESWKAYEDDEKLEIEVPSWSIYGGSYRVTVDKATRKMSCKCLGYIKNGICHHTRGIRWFTTKPPRKHKKGPADTSLESYYAFSKKDLGARQLAVFEKIETCGPLSLRELSEGLHWPEHCVTGRLMEVREMGVVDCAGDKIDEVTHKRVKLWDVV